MTCPDLADRPPWGQALALAREGVAVVPGFGLKANSLRPELPPYLCRCSDAGACREGSPGLHPRKGGWRENATCDAAVISVWARDLAGCNALALTGERSNLVVVAATGEIGAWSLARAEAELGDLPETPASRWGERRERWFRLPPDGAVPFSSRLTLGVDLGAGVEVFGEGGYAAVPGSRVGAGDMVEWAPSPSRRPFARLPPGWLAHIAPNGGAPRRLAAVARPSVRLFGAPR